MSEAQNNRDLPQGMRTYSKDNALDIIIDGAIQLIKQSKDTITLSSDLLDKDYQIGIGMGIIEMEVSTQTRAVEDAANEIGILNVPRITNESVCNHILANRIFQISKTVHRNSEVMFEVSKALRQKDEYLSKGLRLFEITVEMRLTAQKFAEKAANILRKRMPPFPTRPHPDQQDVQNQQRPIQLPQASQQQPQRRELPGTDNRMNDLIRPEPAKTLAQSLPNPVVLQEPPPTRPKKSERASKTSAIAKIGGHKNMKLDQQAIVEQIKLAVEQRRKLALEQPRQQAPEQPRQQAPEQPRELVNCQRSEDPVLPCGIKEKDGEKDN